MYLWELVEGLGHVATAVAFFFTGITFGAFKIPEIIKDWNKSEEFVKTYARGYGTLSTIYFFIAIFYSGFSGHYDIFVIVIGIFAILCSIGLLGFIENIQGHPGWWVVLLHVSSLPLLIKLSHTTYFLTDAILKNNYPLPLYIFLCFSIIFELLLLMFWSLWYYLIMKCDHKNDQTVPFTIWGIEYGDVVSHIIVLLTYANSISNDTSKWDNHILNTYFAFFIINLFLWAIPLVFIMCIAAGESYKDNNEDKWRIMVHIIIVDVITDIPMIVIGMSGRTYIGNLYIMFDMIFKFLMFARSICWIPITISNDDFKVNPFNILEFDGNFRVVKEDNQVSTAQNKDPLWRLVVEGFIAFGISFLMFGIGLMNALFCKIKISGLDQISDKDYFVPHAVFYAVLSTIYFIISVMYSSYNGYYDIFIISVGFISILSTLSLLGFIDKNKKGIWVVAFVISVIALLIKISHTTYFLVDVIVQHNIGSSTSKRMFLATSISFEILLLFFSTLWYFLHIHFENDIEFSLSIWSLEFFDLLSHTVVLLTYAHTISEDTSKWNSYLNVYFSFYIINLFVWVLPLPVILLFLERKVDGDKTKYWIPIHVVILDTITDIPMIITSLVGRTYVGNIYIIFDIVFKILIFARSVCWVSIKVCKDDTTIKTINLIEQAPRGK
eukprot:329773_1